TPVLAMEAGGVGEGVRDGVNGLLVPSGDTDALGDAVRRYFADADLRERLRAAAAASVVEYAPHRVFGELEQRLLEIGSGSRACCSSGGHAPGCRSSRRSRASGMRSATSSTSACSRAPPNARTATTRRFTSLRPSGRAASTAPCSTRR